MKFCSTRGDPSRFDFQDVILQGYAPDGGMYMPVSAPKVSSAELARWENLSYLELVFEVIKLFAEDEIPDGDLRDIVQKSYKRFSNPADPIQLKDIEGGFLMLEMFHGKTMAFKDLSVGCALHLIQYFLKKKGGNITFIIVTSGDTGPAALEASRDVDGTQCIVLLPDELVSPSQRLQMTTVVADNCHVIRCEVSGDELEVDMNRLFRDSDFRNQYSLSTLNSVNVARFLPQAAHLFYAYFQAKKRNPDAVTKLFLPTGGLGNAAAGVLATLMGLPAKLVCTVTNDALFRAVYDNDYSLTTLNVSLAPAMNHACPTNWERVIYLLSGFDTSLVKKLMDEYDKDQKSSPLPEPVLLKLQSIMEVVNVTDEDILGTIRRCYNANDGYLICPHTATGLFGAYLARENDSQFNLAILGVASPAKFSAIMKKTGLASTGRDLVTELECMPQRSTLWRREDWTLGNLRKLVVKVNS